MSSSSCDRWVQTPEGRLAFEKAKRELSIAFQQTKLALEYQFELERLAPPNAPLMLERLIDSLVATKILPIRLKVSEVECQSPYNPMVKHRYSHFVFTTQDGLRYGLLSDLAGEDVKWAESQLIREFAAR
jgi:hypothetical protein